MKTVITFAAAMACTITSVGCSQSTQPDAEGTSNNAVISGSSISGAEANTVVSALYAMGVRPATINADSNEPGGAYRTMALSCYKDGHDCFAVGGSTSSKGAVLPSAAEELYRIVAAFNRTTRPGQIFGDEREAFEVTDLSCTTSAFATFCTVAQTAPAVSGSAISRRELVIGGGLVGGNRSRDNQVDTYEVNVAQDGIYRFTVTSTMYLRIDISDDQQRNEYWGTDTITPRIPTQASAFLLAGRHTVTVKKSRYLSAEQLGGYTIYAEVRPADPE